MSKPNQPAPSTAAPAKTAPAAAAKPADAKKPAAPTAVDEKGDRLSLAGNSSVQKMLGKLGMCWCWARSALPAVTAPPDSSHSLLPLPPSVLATH